MKFFFPDGLDVIDPAFDFRTETHSLFRARQQDDFYAHEVFFPPPYDGILVSKAVMDGVCGGTRQYTVARRHRLMRLGANEFFRLSKGGKRLESMGDCGAFSYVRERKPPFSVREVVEFYNECGFDLGLSTDHVIPFFRSGGGGSGIREYDVPQEWERRQQLTLQLAEEFIRLHARVGKFVPVGVAQGWSTDSYAKAFEQLQRMGYRYIAVGGLAPQKTTAVIATLSQIQTIRLPDTRIHLLGLLRCERARIYRDFGVVSFDTTAPLRHAFKGHDRNYHTLEREYAAIRVPQVDGNIKLQRKIKSGVVAQDEALRLEKECLRTLRLYETGLVRLEEVLEPLREFELVHSGNDERIPFYAEVLQDRPWDNCKCAICQALGIQVVIFRGRERNTRRGFHNIFVLAQRLQSELTAALGANSTEYSRG